MAELLGSPMIRHVYENTVLNPLVDLTVVATCDEEIAEYVVSVGGRAVMTSNEHVRATDRCAEAVVIVEEEDGVRFDIVVMVQGDEPMTHPGMITEAVEPLLDDPSIPVTTLLGKSRQLTNSATRTASRSYATSRETPCTSPGRRSPVLSKTLPLVDTWPSFRSAVISCFSTLR